MRLITGGETIGKKIKKQNGLATCKIRRSAEEGGQAIKYFALLPSANSKLEVGRSLPTLTSGAGWMVILYSYNIANLNGTICDWAFSSPSLRVCQTRSS